MFKPYLKISKPSKWLLGHKIKTVEEVYQTKRVAIMEDDGEYTVLPSWWAKCITIKRFKAFVDKGCLYSAQRNPYR